MTTMEVISRRYTAMFVPPVAPSKAWTTKIKYFTCTLVVSLEPAAPETGGPGAR